MYFMFPAVTSSALTLMHTMVPPYGIVGGNNVIAVASLDNDVFIVRYGCPQIEVYNADNYAYRFRIIVPGLTKHMCGITACGRNKCVYLSDEHRNWIHRAELSVSGAVKNWWVSMWPQGLSVNNAHNLVVACCRASTLQEYTTHGTLVREIRLHAGVTKPGHAIQLPTGDYVVSQCLSPGAVSVVNVGGEVIYSYGPSYTSDIGQMMYPKSLAVTSNDDILVSDQMRDRILSLNRSLSHVHALTLSVDGGIQYPSGTCMCLDESRGRLYVVEGTAWLSTSCRVLVFDVTATP